MLFPSLPDSASIWFFASSRMFSNEQKDEALNRIHSLLSSWTSHGRKVEAGVELVHNTVFTIGAFIMPEELNSGVSGCGIDKLTDGMNDIASAIGIDWTGPLDIVVLDSADQPILVTRSEFKRQAEAGLISEETRVLDLTAPRVGDVRQNGVFKRVGDSWHRQLMPASQPA